MFSALGQAYRRHVSCIRHIPIVLLVSTDADDIMAGTVLKKQEKIFTPLDLPREMFRYYLTGPINQLTAHQLTN